MDTVTIILIVLILVLIYLLYTYFTDSAVQLISTADLNNEISAISDVSKPLNRRYGHSVWIYVSSWDNNAQKNIISREGQFRLYLEQSAPTLKLDMNMNNEDNSIQTMIITNNFPLQKWVCIAISVDNQFVDAYLDGKLVRSQRFYDSKNNVMLASPPKKASLYLGKDSRFDAYATLFKRWTEPISPEAAWDNYMKGNGSSKMTSALNDIGIDLSVLQNNEEIKKISLM